MLAFIVSTTFSGVPTVAVADSVLHIGMPASVHAGDTIIVPIVLATDDPIGFNAFEASCGIEGGASITSLETGGSAFTLWPERTITGVRSCRVVGGGPSFVSGSSLNLFSLAIKTQAAGAVSVRVEATAYRGDGRGTPRVLRPAAISFVVSPASATATDAVTALNVRDATPPEPFVPELARDESVFEGKYFLSFAAADAESGIAGYMVSEGDAPVVASDGTYVLHDQNLHTPVVVRASDGAGNVREETWQSTREVSRDMGSYTITSSKWLIAFAVLFITAFVWIFVRRSHI